MSSSRPIEVVAERVPGDWMLHPVALGSALVMALNDRVLKGAFASWWTGKLSDVAGLIFFPWLLLAVGELIRWMLGRPGRRTSRRMLEVCVGVTFVGFAAINLSDELGHHYEAAVRSFWAPWRDVLPSELWPGRARHTVDPTDLLAAPALLVPWLLGLRRIRREEGIGGACVEGSESRDVGSELDRRRLRRGE